MTNYRTEQEAQVRADVYELYFGKEDRYVVEQRSPNHWSVRDKHTDEIMDELDYAEIMYEDQMASLPGGPGGIL